MHFETLQESVMPGHQPICVLALIFCCLDNCHGAINPPPPSPPWNSSVTPLIACSTTWPCILIPADLHESIGLLVTVAVWYSLANSLSALRIPARVQRIRPMLTVITIKYRLAKQPWFAVAL